MISTTHTEPLHTNLVEFNGVVLGADRGQQLLGSLAVWAVGLGEDSYDGSAMFERAGLCR